MPGGFEFVRPLPAAPAEPARAAEVAAQKPTAVEQALIHNVERLAPFVLALAAAIVVLVVFGSARARPALVGKQQVAAVPLRANARGDLEVLLVTTRGSGRWTVPKGWPMRGLSDHDAAAREAFEEAGVTGRVSPQPIGSFDYTKRNAAGERFTVTLYRLDVEREVRRFRERGQRKRRWVSPAEAATLVSWPGLSTAISELAETPAR